MSITAAINRIGVRDVLEILREPTQVNRPDVPRDPPGLSQAVIGR